MNKLIKKSLAVLMALALAGSVTACGNDNKSTKNPSGSSADSVYQLGQTAQNVKGTKQGVYYEMFVRSFADSNGDGVGDFKGATEKLDYLNDGNPATTTDLGVTGIWMMPINSTPSYHGYDVSDYYAINPEYGTMADYENFIKEAHKRGINIMMDLVLNHTSTENEWFKQSQDPNSPYRNWYRSTTDGSEGYNLTANVWGHNVWNKLGGAYYYAIFWSGMPDLNYDTPAVHDELKKIASYWMDKGVDGFRLDAVPHIYGSNELPNSESGEAKSVAVLKEFTDYCHSKNPNSFVIGEVLDENTTLRSTYLASLDSVFHIGLGNQIANAVRGGSSKNNFLAKFIEGNYAQYASKNPNYVDAPVLSNHDQNRIIGSLKGKPELMKVAASIYLTIEGVPFVYYGEEIGMFGAKPDEDIRLPLEWGKDDKLQTKWRPNKYGSVTVPIADQEKDPNSLLTHYKRLIRVRNENEAIYAGKFKAMESGNDAIVMYAMTSANQTAYVIHNLSAQPQTITLDTTGYTLKFCQTKDGFAAKDKSITIPALSSVIYVK